MARRPPQPGAGHMSWEEEIRELRKREQLAYQMGGAEKVARQHEFNLE